MAHSLDGKTMVEGQIDPASLPDYAAQGVTMVINNRPDHEDHGQPTSAEVEAAARACGMDYAHVPIARGMGPADIEAMRAAMKAAGEGKVLAYCRSGNRSTLAWAVARSADGVERDELERCAAGAGFSIAPVAHLL